MKGKKSGIGYGVSSVFIMGIFIGALLWGILRIEPLREEALYNHTRLLVVDALKALENGEIPDTPYAYAVVDLKGKVHYADEVFGFGDEVPLVEVAQFDKSFWKENEGLVKSTFIIQKDGEARGFALFLIPKEEAYRYSDREMILDLFGPLMLAIGGLGIAMLSYGLYIKRQFLKPIEKICLSSESIIKGDYDVVVGEALDKEIKSSEIGSLAYVFELMRDELKAKQERENKLKKAQKELIACISHDLKTPLSSIKAYSEGLGDGVITDPEKRKRYASVIMNKADALNSMINDLLEHSKAELHVLTIEKTEVYFTDYFQKATEELKLVIEKAGMICELQNDAPNRLIEIDTRRMTQVIENLVSNSIKYAVDGGWIGIQSRCCDNHIIISVKDKGKGIEHLDIPYVFDKFYRGEKSRNSTIAGSGLGLSICKYIVEEHNGRIECTSKVGEGTSFSVYIPI
ncbi:MAG: sensor histidine kinase [Cellulosilyticaceae bacterium]